MQIVKLTKKKKHAKKTIDRKRFDNLMQSKLSFE